MGLTASSDECGDLVRRYGGRRSGDGMGFEALVQTLCQAREGSIDAANGFVRRYVTSLCSNEAVGHAPLLVGSIGVLGIFDWRAWDLRLPVSSSMELCCWDCNGTSIIECFIPNHVPRNPPPPTLFTAGFPSDFACLPACRVFACHRLSLYGSSCASLLSLCVWGSQSAYLCLYRSFGLCSYWPA